MSENTNGQNTALINKETKYDHTHLNDIHEGVSGIFIIIIFLYSLTGQKALGTPESEEGNQYVQDGVDLRNMALKVVVCAGFLKKTT